MAKRSKEQTRRRKVIRASYKIIDPTGVIPVARPASNIQLTPIVQPVSLVPYSTQSQPLYTEDEGYEEDYIED